MKETDIRIGGVPEHFNFPWKLRINENGNKGVTWSDFAGGSGAMLQALESGELHAALVLTEAVAHAQRIGKKVLPLAVFVESPLVWGIFSGAKNQIAEISGTATTRYAISRFGSGSHLMAQVDAFIRGKKLEPDQFVELGNLEKAAQSLQNLETDLFLWEKWMTKPLVDNGLLKMVGERPTPWSCFLLVVSEPFSKETERMEVLKKIHLEVLEKARQFHQSPNAAKQLAENYGLRPEDAAVWLNQVRWAETWIDPKDQLTLASDWLEKVKS